MDDLLTDDDFDCYDEDEELLTFQRMLAFEPALDRWRPSVRHEERGDHMAALISYSRALDELSPEEICSSFWGSLVVSGRRRARWALGIALDGTDRLAVAGAVERVDRYFDVLDALRVPKVEAGRVEVWSRSELLLAQERWPQRITADSIADYYREVERALHTCGGGVIVVQRTLESTDDAGATVAWPPARNQGCWCDSGVRYKRCCGGEPLAEGRLAWGPGRLREGAELAVCRV